MRDNIRRPLLFLITVGTGSLIIVIDASVDVIIAGTVLAGFVALLITGALEITDLNPSRLRATLREQLQSKTKKPNPATEKPGLTTKVSSLFQRFTSRLKKSADMPERDETVGMLGTLAASIRETITHARAPESEKKKTIEKLDAMLDQAIDNPDPIQPQVPSKAASGGAIDPLAALADLDLDSLEDLDLDGSAGGPETVFEPDQISLISEEEADAVSEILKAHESDSEEIQIDLSDAQIDLPEGPGVATDLSGLPDMGALDADLSTLDDLDLDEIEVEGEEIADEEVATADEPIPAEDILEDIAEQPEEDFDMVSFASGGLVDDDLIAALKSDVKKKKFVEDISLVRELRGEKYAAKDLAGELEEVLAMLKPE